MTTESVDWRRFCLVTSKITETELERRIARDGFAPITYNTRIRLVVAKYFLSSLVERKTFEQTYTQLVPSSSTREQNTIISILEKLQNFIRETGMEEGLPIEQYIDAIESTDDINQKRLRFVTAARYGFYSMIEKALIPRVTHTTWERIQDLGKRLFGYSIGNEWITGEVFTQAFQEAVNAGHLSIVRMLLYNPIFFERVSYRPHILVSAIHSAKVQKQSALFDLLLMYSCVSCHGVISRLFFNRQMLEIPDDRFELKIIEAAVQKYQVYLLADLIKKNFITNVHFDAYLSKHPHARMCYANFFIDLRKRLDVLISEER